MVLPELQYAAPTSEEAGELTAGTQTGECVCDVGGVRNLGERVGGSARVGVGGHEGTPHCKILALSHPKGVKALQEGSCPPPPTPPPHSTPQA